MKGTKINCNKDLPEKWCRKCQKFYPRTKDFFYENKKSYDKLLAVCKGCANKRQAKYKDRYADTIFPSTTKEARHLKYLEQKENGKRKQYYANRLKKVGMTNGDTKAI